MSPSELGLMIRIESMIAPRNSPRARSLSSSLSCHSSDVTHHFLSTDGQPFRQHGRQAGVDDFFLRCCQIVFQPPLFDDVALDVVNTIRGVPIPVARLADAPNVDEIFFAGL